jgi:hypothetical protein
MLLLLSAALTLCAAGCAEGMLWRTGHLAPWVRKTWEEEEKVATTLMTKKQHMSDAVAAVAGGPIASQSKMAEQLHQVIFRDPVVLLRLHAVDLLSELNCQESVDALRAAAKDRNLEIRVAAVKSLAHMPENQAIPILQDAIGSDTNGDVRLAATQSLGAFSSSQTLNALAMAIDDKDPALQVAAIESLEKVTGQRFGTDALAWKSYLGNQQLGANSQPVVAEQVDPLDNSSQFRR